MATSITRETQTNTAEHQPSEHQPSCGICYIDLNNKNTVITRCDHAYCTTCFFKWIDRKETCALCRKVLLSDAVVEERLLILQDVQTDIIGNYRNLRILKRNIKQKERIKNNLADDVESLMNRQIRMRYLLQETRSVCRYTLSNSKLLNKSVQLQRRSLDLMQHYIDEWEELRAPSQTELAAVELAEEAVELADEAVELAEEIDIVNMTTELDNMARLESRRARTTLLQLSLERAALDDDSSDDEQDDAQDDAHEYQTEAQNNLPQPFDFTPRRILRVQPRDHRQSPMFVFGQESNQDSH